MLKKAKIYSLLFIVIASAAVGLVSFPQRAGAQSTVDTSGLYIQEDAQKELVAKLWREAMMTCLKLGGEDESHLRSELAHGEWFLFAGPAGNRSFLDGLNPFKKTDTDRLKDAAPNVGYLIDGTDGKMWCNEGSSSAIGAGSDFIKNFDAIYNLSSGDTSSYMKAACTLGFRPSDEPDISDSDCSGNANQRPEDTQYSYPSRDKARAVIDSKYTFKLFGQGPPTAEQLYILYAQTFMTACSPQNPVTTIPDGKAGDYIMLQVVNVVDGKGQITDTYYTVSDTDEKNVSVDESGGNERKNCSKIAAAANGTNAEAYRDWLTQHPELAKGPGASTETGVTPPSSCQITAIGWIICPVVNFLAGVVDGSYWALDRLFLRLPPVNLDTSDDTNGTYKAWSVMRDLANIIFVIAFLIIVFSQVTSIGITNYGMKRLIPKLIMAAILVNVSYILCAIAVDISNIIGSSLKDLLDTVRVTTGVTATELNSGGGFWKDTAVQALAVSLVAGAVVLAWATAGLLLVGLLAIVPIILTVLITMLVRQAFVVLLIVIAPLAFVALLLPNTEGYYKKWLELFKAMLMLYPIVALLFGASALASDILMSAAKDSGGDGFQALNGIVAGVVRIMPLVLIPAVMKISSGVFGRITGMVNDRQKGWFDAKRNQAGDLHKMQKAEQGARIGRWANREGRFGAGRRAIGSISSHGAATRELRRSKQLKTAEENAQAAALQSITVTTPEVLVGAKNAEARLHTAENEAAATGTNLADHTLEVGARNAELTKERAENNAKTYAEEHASQELKIQQATSAQNLTNAQNKDKQIYTEITAVGSDHPKLADLKVDDTTANAAKASTIQSKAINSAVSTANTESETKYAEQIQDEVRKVEKGDPAGPLLTQAGGNINAKVGQSRAAAQAQTTVNKAQAESIDNEEKTMTRIPPTTYTDSRGTTIGGLEKIVDNKALSAERRAAAAGMRGKTGGATDVMEAWDQLGKAMNDALAAGDTKEIEAVKLMQQQFMAEAGNKLPASVTGQAKGAMSRGGYTGGVDAEILETLHKGDFSGELLSGLHPKELERIETVLSTTHKSGLLTDTQALNLGKLQTSIKEYRKVAEKLGKGLTGARDDHMTKIETIK